MTLIGWKSSIWSPKSVVYVDPYLKLKPYKDNMSVISNRNEINKIGNETNKHGLNGTITVATFIHRDEMLAYI